MKILVATQSKGGLDDLVSPVFARAPTFTIVEVENKEIKKTEVETNTAASGFSGVGIQAAQFAASKGINVVIAGNFGPNASMVLSQAGIKVSPGFSGMKAKEAVENYLKGGPSTPAYPTMPPRAFRPALPSTMRPPTIPRFKPSKVDMEFEKRMLELQKEMVEEQIKYLDEKIKDLEKKE